MNTQENNYIHRKVCALEIVKLRILVKKLMITSLFIILLIGIGSKFLYMFSVALSIAMAISLCILIFINEKKIKELDRKYILGLVENNLKNE